MEPLIGKSEDYNYAFFQRMIESIKQTKDAQNPDDEEANKVSLNSDIEVGLVWRGWGVYVFDVVFPKNVLKNYMFSTI